MFTHMILPSLARQFLAPVTADIAEVVVYERNVAGQVRPHNADDDLIDDGAESLFVFTQESLSLLAHR
jgi:hypothetical protein